MWCFDAGFSLPSAYGIGCFSKEAYEFADMLKKSGQTKWQILPLGPTGYGDSPYQSFSTFAGNPYFIDPETLVKEGLLTKKSAKKACPLPRVSPWTGEHPMRLLMWKPLRRRSCPRLTMSGCIFIDSRFSARRSPVFSRMHPMKILNGK